MVLLHAAFKADVVILEMHSVCQSRFIIVSLCTDVIPDASFWHKRKQSMYAKVQRN